MDEVHPLFYFFFFRLSKNPSSFSPRVSSPLWGGNSPMARPKARSASFCSPLRLRGTCTVTVTYWSPRTRLLFTEGMPFPRRRKVVPLWVPSGRVHLTFPSMVGISSSAPRVAWRKVTD